MDAQDNDGIDTRQNFDKRTSRLQHKRDFEYAINQFMSKNPSSHTDATIETKVEERPIQPKSRNRHHRIQETEEVIYDSDPPPPPPMQNDANQKLGEKEQKVVRWFQNLCHKDHARASFMLLKLASIHSNSGDEYLHDSASNADYVSNVHPPVVSLPRSNSDNSSNSSTHRDSSKYESKSKSKSKSKKHGRHKHNHETRPSNVSVKSSQFRVCVRKRPIFPKELEADFDVVDASKTGNDSKIILFDTRMKADLKGMFMIPQTFRFHHVFGEKASNADVFAVTALPLVEHAMDGGKSTVFMFGQTGSGKTYTLTGLLERALDAIFAYRSVEVTLSMFQLIGGVCQDLSRDNNQCVVRPLEADDGSIYFQGLANKRYRNYSEIVADIEFGQLQRATCETGVHDQSSRSHAFYELHINTGSGQEPGKMLFVDLAGSERNKDSFYHDAKLRKECADINQSLMALKNVWRATVAGNRHVPYRDSVLTRILKPSFESAMTTVIATLSPCSGDTEHSLSTLNNVASISGFPSNNKGAKHIAVRSVKGLLAEKTYQKAMEQHPKKWSAAQVIDWWTTHTTTVPPPNKVTGEMLLRWPERRFIQYCTSFGESSPELERLGSVIYSNLRNELSDIRKYKDAKTATSV